MSDFDKILRDKLNEEESFPRMDRNWQRLNARLPVEPVVPKYTWGHWAMAASVAALIGASIWFWHELSKTKTELAQVKAEQKENNQAQQKVPQDVYQSTQKDVDMPNTLPNVSKDLPKNNIVTTDKIEEKLKKQEPAAASTFSKKSEATVTPDIAKQNYTGVNAPSVSKQNDRLSQPHKEVVQSPVVKNKIEPKVKEDENVIVNNKPLESVAHNSDVVKNNDKPIQKTPSSGEQVVKKDNEIVENVGKKEDSNISVNKKNEPVKEEDKNVTASTTDNQNTKSDNPSVKNEVENQQTMPSNVVKVDEPKVYTENKTTESVAKTADKKEETKQEDMPAPPIVQPISRHSKISLGANGLVYSAINSAGLPSIKSYGASLRVGVTEKLQIEAGYETGKSTYKFSIPQPRFHHPKTPNNPPPGNDIELREITGTQIRGLFSLNLNYLLTTDKWVNPYVSIGYASQRVASQEAEFQFFDRRTNRNTIIVAPSETETFSNLWCVGLGLDKPIIKHLSLNLSASYQKDLSKEVDDAFLLRGGLRFTF